MFDVRQLPQMTTRQSAVRIALVLLLHLALLWLAMRISANSDPRSGRASFGQPTVSSCPIPF